MVIKLTKPRLRRGRGKAIFECKNAVGYGSGRPQAGAPDTFQDQPRLAIRLLRKCSGCGRGEVWQSELRLRYYYQVSETDRS